MNNHQEYRVVLVLVGIFLLLLIPAVWLARAEVRDDLRRQDITNLKRAIEQYFNRHQYYPTPPTTEACTSSSPDSWFFGDRAALLREQHIDVIPHDVRENQQYYYSYCATAYDRNGKTRGYYLQAQLERPAAATRAFDEDEERKFYFRVLNDHDQVLYRVCGGNEKQCET